MPDSSIDDGITPTSARSGSRPHEIWLDEVHAPSPAAEMLARILSRQLDVDTRGSLAAFGAADARVFIGLALAARPGETVAGIDAFSDDGEAAFRAALDRHIPDRHPRVLGVKADSRRIAVADWISLLRAPARLVHLAGGRTRAGVVDDLALAGTYLAPRAAVLVEGFLDERHPELTEGVLDALRAARGIVPVAVLPRGPEARGGTPLVCAARPGAQAYRTLLMQHFQDRLPAIRRFAGHEIVTFDAD